MQMQEINVEERLAALKMGEQLGIEVPDSNGVPSAMQWGDLHNDVKACNRGLEAVLDSAIKDGRDLNEQEANAYSYLVKIKGNNENELDKRGKSGSKEPRALWKEPLGSPAGALSTGRQNRGSGAASLMSPETGKRIPAFAGTEAMFDGDAGENTVGQIGAAVALGDFSNLSPALKAAVTGGGEGGGSYMLQPEVSGRVIDLARSASVVARAGAQSIPMNTSEMSLLRVLSDPTVSARREMQAVEATKPTFGSFTLQARMYSAIVPITIEQLEDAANAPAVIEQTLRAALGQAMDRAVLTGAGGAEVLGITNAGGTNERATVGTPANFADVSQAVGDIMGANYDGDPANLAWIMNPRDGGTYDRLQASDNQPLRPTPWAGALRQFPTTSLDVDGGETDMIVGAFDQVLIGLRTGGVVFDVVDSGSITADGETINAASQFVRFLRARIRFDSVLMRPDWFTVLRGVTN
ncbi:phage major capsid protein [Thioalkalivibrio sp. AKL19]|uniref:phage major capsid protein n=1 Tax=Thioalkalivibrio sp. AKL19 TaxID=1266914 RepID=UPI0009DBCB51|nr:phage major capsid protein [Thioalkalivibrio sp. AKL19]